MTIEKIHEFTNAEFEDALEGIDSLSMKELFNLRASLEVFYQPPEQLERSIKALRRINQLIEIRLLN